jgi:hypothetical protein
MVTWLHDVSSQLVLNNYCSYFPLLSVTTQLSKSHSRRLCKMSLLVVSFASYYLLMELSPSCEAAIVQTFRKFPAILRNPKVHHRVHKSPPLVPILSQFNSVHTVPSYLSKIHCNIVHPPMSWSF